MRICKLFFALILLNVFFYGTIFAQTTAPTAPTPPTAPSGSTLNMPSTSIQMPQMPSVSAPVPGSGFYTPGTQYQQKQKPEEKQEEQKIEKSTASTTLEQILTEATGGNLKNLTAWDLNQLAERGAIGNLSSLNAVANNAGLNTSNLTSIGNSAAQQKMLSQILQELEQIKAAQKNMSVAPVGAKPSNMPPKILRFVVNSGDVLGTCTNIYFSEQENDGTFLLTGDARTLVGNETISETFYLLFTSSGTKNSQVAYTVTPTLVQSKPYESRLKTFCSASNLMASRTGNLVMLHYSQNTEEAKQNFDLLLDVGSPRINAK